MALQGTEGYKKESQGKVEWPKVELCYSKA